MGAISLWLRDIFQPHATVEPGVPLDKVPFVVLDTELTGLDPRRDSVVSVGAVKMHGTRIELGRTFYRLVRPASEMGHEGILVHGITPGEVADRPALGDVVAELAQFCGDRVLVGHFLSLDLTFLGREPGFLEGGTAVRGRVVDTCRIHEWSRRAGQPVAGAFQADEDLNLFVLARRRGIHVEGAHNALRDAFITAQLLQRQLRELPALGVRTLGDLLRVGKP